ncbi:TetR/AcrR family transcriptional regulator [Aminipila terrae]|uniref:TetR family transcriptional regulator n=1 Tax=Aminipila terrae TaxID=2697030 RepID=A0A6P1MHK4_9FIRM|nr:TetR/AcrR family transcriptional regulator [Aminipila terrae]QHI73542.1 TetR family transcriptional regulator [Aminipila terrae]
MEDKKESIFKCGKELFSLKGFKDTNVSDITKMAGVAVGTFYNYYSSKEKLFLEIFLKENENLKKSFESADIDNDPLKAVKQLMSLNYNGINSNPILREWYNKELFSRLEKEFFHEGGIKKIQELMNSNTVTLIRNWKLEGKIRKDLDDDLILAIFNAIPYIDIHKEDIGMQHFPQLVDYLTEFIMKGLTDCSNQEVNK